MCIKKSGNVSNVRKIKIKKKKKEKKEIVRRGQESNKVGPELGERL